MINNTDYHDAIAERFWKKVKMQDEGCWEWQGAIGSHGYGNFCIIKPVFARAHRFAFELFNGRPAIPNACHTWDNPICCRPDHMFEGTTKDNVRDKIIKGRASGGTKVLSENDREVIHALCNNDGLTHQEVANMFGVSRERVGQIARGA